MNEKMYKQLEKLERKKQKEALKLEKANQKKIQKEERMLKSATRPGECIKYIETIIDAGLVGRPEGSEIVSRLLSVDLRYEVVMQVVSNLITFNREDCLTKEKTKEKEAIVVIPVEEFISQVYLQIYGREEQIFLEVNSESLFDFCCRCQDACDGSKITIVVCGLDEYFKNKKTTKRRKGTEEPTHLEGNPKKRKKIGEESYTDRVSRIDIESALVAVQVELGVNVRVLANPGKVSEFITQMVKAVAEKPHRLNKMSDAFSWYAEGSSTNCVKVDKNGAGLLLLWQQQLEQFTNVGPQVVRAISNRYPSPQSLIQAYKNLPCDEAAALLADIEVRRGVGVLSNTRRVGGELSKKIYKFFTVRDPDVCL